ncbi:NHL repeat-containing protein [Pseudomonadota bacterium]
MRTGRFTVVLILAVLCAPLSVALAQDIQARLIATSTEPLVLPHDLVLTPDGQTLVVADMGGERIVFLDPDTLALKGSFGEGDLAFPHDVAFDNEGRLWVADSGNDRVVLYTLDGLEATQVDAWEGLYGPEGITVAPNGAVYIALVGENRLVCMRDGEIEASASLALGADLSRPHDIDILTDEGGFNLIASDPGHHRLVVFSKGLIPLYEISTWDPPFTEPKYFAIDENNRLFVADQYNHTIRVFDASSSPQGQFADNEVKLPEGITVRGKRAWVSDTEGGRVLLYDLVKMD